MTDRQTVREPPPSSITVTVSFTPAVTHVYVFFLFFARPSDANARASVAEAGVSRRRKEGGHKIDAKPGVTDV